MRTFRAVVACILGPTAFLFFILAVDPIDPNGGDAWDGTDYGWIAAVLAFATYAIAPKP